MVKSSREADSSSSPVNGYADLMRRVALVVLCLACGPSFQAVYEGDARFEHCYALEETSNVTMLQKAECWRDFTQRHTYGQTRDRVEYAASRYHALVNPELPTDEAMMQAAPGMVDTTKQLAAPAPTSAFAPPPVTTAAINVPTAAPSATHAPPPPTPSTPAQTLDASASTKPITKLKQCATDCDVGFDACMSQPRDSGTCDGIYRNCVNPCLKEK